MTVRWASFLVIIGVSLACESATDVLVRDDSPIQTDSLVYHLRKLPGVYDAWAVATYTNRSGAPVYFVRCTHSSTGPLHYVVREPPDTTGSFVGRVWACVGGVPTGEVRPGSTLTATVWLGSTESPYADPPIQPDWRVGLFRIAFELYAEPGVDPDPRDQLPVEQRCSNVFEIRF